MKIVHRKLASVLIGLGYFWAGCKSIEPAPTLPADDSIPPVASEEDGSLGEELAQETEEASPQEAVQDDDQVETSGAIDQALETAEKGPEENAVTADAAISDELKKAEIPIEINAAVQQWIEYFTNKDRDRFTRYLERGEKFKPMIIAALKAQGIPTEIYYQALIESGFATHATSSAKAVGIWQFIKGTGRRYGLRVDRYVDERRDPIRSTVAAALYLKDLNNVFQSWYLALASYNAGEGRILHAIMRGKSRDFWQLARDKMLPSETMHYIPKFLAATIIGHNLKYYGIEEISKTPAPQMISIATPSPVRLADIAKVAGVSLWTIRELNPHLLRGVTPPGVATYRVWVPKEKGSQVEGAFDQLAAKKVNGLAPDRSETASVESKIHKVVRGESLAQVAKRYGVSMQQLKKLNRLRSTRISAGTRLRIPATKVADTDAEILSYRVRRGDNLDKVARRFGITVGELKRINGLRKNRLQVGQVLNLKEDKG